MMAMSQPVFEPSHFPVMCQEIITMAAPNDGDIFIDATFGNGGYSRALLQAADCSVYAIDRDPTVKASADRLAAEFPGRFHFIAGCFSRMDELMREQGIAKLEGVVMDIGVSSMQIDEAPRGFSFQNDGPLDMRMSTHGLSARDVVNDLAEDDLANIIYQYGEEKKSRRIARAIVEARSRAPILRTGQLAALIEKAVGYRRYIKGKRQKHPATRSFQALRIYVNDELGELESGLAAAEKILAPDGRLCVVSFHSLEDRIVKNFFKIHSGISGQGSRHMPQLRDEVKEATFKMIRGGAVKPSKAETQQNIRSRSAKLRGAIRTSATILKDQTGVRT